MSLEDLTTDQLLAHARALEGSHNLLQTMLKDPTAREMVQRQIKKIRPELAIPELDAKDAISAELKVEREARMALERQITEDRVRKRLEDQRAKAQNQYRLSDADMIEVEKLMTDEANPIPTYDAAARVHSAMKQTAVPTTHHLQPPTYEMPENDVWGKGVGNKAELNRIAMNEAYKALGEIQAGKPAAGYGLGPASAN